MKIIGGIKVCDRELMRPGDVFVFFRDVKDALMGWGRVLVVVDKTTEIDFWTGDKNCVGDAMPGIPFVLLSESKL